MATATLRSSRRSKGLTTRSSARNNMSALDNNNAMKYQQSPDSGRNNKRPRDSLDEEKELISTKKRAKFTIDAGHKKRARDALDEDEELISTKRAKIAIEIEPYPNAKNQPKAGAVIIQVDRRDDVILKRSKKAAAAAAVKEAKTQTSTERAPPAPAKHHQKVVNGIKHELDRLQDRLAPPKPDKYEKRKLRSQENTRFKSELSQYFPDYDEVIGNDPKEDHILDSETPIVIVDGGAKSSSIPSSSTRKANEYALKDFPSSLFDDLHNAERVDFSFLDTHYKDDGLDPLSDEYFELIHRRPERAEKGLRNHDRGRAQHEKDQVIRLLEDLQGSDWLKVLGVSGVTDSRKKEFKPARNHFIKGCQAIIEKFRLWREEEKRRKLEKEQAVAEEKAEVEAEEVEDEVEEEEVEEELDEAEDADGYASDGDPPDYSDVDASAARQLHEEAIARLHASKRLAKRKAEPIPPAEPTLERDFKSFFAKPHLREAALGRSRKSGRSVAAWGHPVPEVPPSEFVLPDEYRDEETLKARARKKRRDRRLNKT